MPCGCCCQYRWHKHVCERWALARPRLWDAQVKAGASVRERDSPGGHTPMHLAADAGQGDAVAALVALGAPLEARSAKGFTPLALATFKARPACSVLD